MKAGSAEALITAIDAQASDIQSKVKLALNWLFALLALLSLIAIYIPDIFSRASKLLYRVKCYYNKANIKTD